MNSKLKKYSLMRTMKSFLMRKGVFIVTVLLAISACLFGGSLPAEAGKVVVDPNNPIQDMKNNLLIPKDVANAKANITVDNASKTYKYYVEKNKGDYSGDFVGLVEGNKNIRYGAFQKEYGQTNLVLEGVTSSTRVNIDYGRIGIYKDQKVNVKLVLSDIKMYSDSLPWDLMNNDYTKTHFRDDGYKNTNGAMSKSKKRTVFWISDNLFSGIVYHSTQMNVQLIATYSDGSPVNFDGDTFISFNSLNPAAGASTKLKGEYAFYNKMTSTDWYVRQDTVLAEFKSFYNNLNVVGGKDGGNSQLTSAHHEFNNSHDRLGDPKFGQATVSFRISGANPLFVIGSSNVQTWFCLSSATPFSVVPDKPVKTGVDKNGVNVDGKMLQVGDTIQYRVKQKVTKLGEDQLAVYDRFELIDNLPKEVDYLNAHVETGSNKAFDQSGEVSYNKANHQVKYAANSNTLKNRMKYERETYELVINVKVNDLAKQNSVAKNQGKSIINKVEKNTNIITVYFPKIPTKEVHQNGEDVNGRNDGKGGPETDPLAAGTDVEFIVKQKWHTKDVDTVASNYKQFGISDPLDQRLTYIDGSAKIVDQSTGQDITSQGALKYDQATRTLSWEASKEFLAANQLNGREIHLIFSAKTPYNDEFNIKNKATVNIDNNASSTNEVIIGVKFNLQPIRIAETGSNRILLLVITAFSLIGLGILVGAYKLKNW